MKMFGQATVDTTNLLDLFLDAPTLQLLIMQVMQGDGSPPMLSSVRQVLRLGATCKRLRAACRDPAIWRCVDATATLRELYLAWLERRARYQTPRGCADPPPFCSPPLFDRMLPCAAVQTRMMMGVPTLSLSAQLGLAWTRHDLEKLWLRNHTDAVPPVHELACIGALFALRRRLRSLRLTYCGATPPTELPANVHHLRIEHYETPPPSGVFAAMYPGVTKLTLINCAEYAAALVYGCPMLEVLDMRVHHFGTASDGDSRIAALVRPEQVVELHDALLHRARSLRVLALRSACAAPALLISRSVEIGGFPALRRLHVRLVPEVAAFCEMLPESCPRLRCLAIEGARCGCRYATGAGVLAISKLRELKELSLPLSWREDERVDDELLELSRSDGAAFVALEFSGGGLPPRFWLGRRCCDIRSVGMHGGADFHVDELVIPGRTTLEEVALCDDDGLLGGGFCKEGQRTVLSKCRNLSRISLQIGDDAAMVETARLCVANVHDLSIRHTKYSGTAGVLALLSAFPELTRLHLHVPMPFYEMYSTAVARAVKSCPYLQQIHADQGCACQLRRDLPAHLTIVAH